VPGWGGLYILVMVVPSMVVLIIDQFGIVTVETECQSPVAIDPDGPVTRKASGQFMQFCRVTSLCQSVSIFS
jgi:hypothetical protein